MQETRFIPLFPAATAGPAFAARFPDAEPRDLPTLSLPDGQYLVRFRRPDAQRPPRAYVLRQAKGRVGDVQLAFPERSVSFTVDENGEVDLPGIELDELAHLRIELLLEPLALDGEPENGS